MLDTPRTPFGDLRLTCRPDRDDGDLMRFTESGYRAVFERKQAEWPAVRVYAAIVLAFAAGAVVGALLTRAWHTHTAWVPAGLLAAIVLSGRRQRGAIRSAPSMRMVSPLR